MNRKGERMKDPLGGRGDTIYYDFIAVYTNKYTKVWIFGK